MRDLQDLPRCKRRSESLVRFMKHAVEYNELDEAMRRGGSTWDVAQAHGLLCSRLAAEGVGAGVAWIEQILGAVAPDSAQGREIAELLDALYDSSYRQLAERRSEFELLLPEDSEPASWRAEALAHWCEGFLHGLVSGQPNERLRAKLAEEPLSDIIGDMLQITRASADAEDDDETNEAAYVELVEYVRVGVQLAYEELAPFRTPLGAADGGH